MNKLKIFDSKEFGEVRMVSIDDKPYAVANDIALALGYKQPKDAITRHCKGAMKHSYPTNGGVQEVKIIPEGDIYRLIIQSNLPSAEKFESWVMDEVLPSIRKHGAYMTDEVIDKLKENPNYINDLISDIKQLGYQNKQLQDANNYYHTCFDEIMEFIVEKLGFNKGKTIPRAKMYNTYAMWCNKKNYAIYGDKLFHELMQERTIDGHAVIMSQGKYLNIIIR